ncbi:MAG: transcription antitermination factor NusB [Eubacteriales bacterium]|nr:transcription antitermination factor NusB [Eubacteriales bacterium]
MKRKEARETMASVFYQMDIRSGFPDEKLDVFIDRGKMGNQYEYCVKLFGLYRTNLKDADALISKYSRRWNINRMAKMDLAILRLAVFEIMEFEDIPDAVSANEAVELAKKYGTDNAPKFINAILGSILRSEKK